MFEKESKLWATSELTCVKIPKTNLFYNSKAHEEIEKRWNRRFYKE